MMKKHLPGEIRVYWANVEFNYEEGSEGFGTFQGGYVYAFAKAHDAREAMKRIEEEMGKQHLGIHIVDYVSQYAEVPWEFEEDQLHFDGVAALAASTGEVVLDSFEAYDRR